MVPSLSQFCDLCIPLSVHQVTIKRHELPIHSGYGGYGDEGDDGNDGVVGAVSVLAVILMLKGWVGG